MVLEVWLKVLFEPDQCFRGNIKNIQGWSTGSSFSPCSAYIRAVLLKLLVFSCVSTESLHRMAEVNRRTQRVKNCEAQKYCVVSNYAVLHQRIRCHYTRHTFPFAGSQLGLESPANWDALPVVYKAARQDCSGDGSLDPSRCPVPVVLWCGAVGRLQGPQEMRR